MESFTVEINMATSQTGNISPCIQFDGLAQFHVANEAMLASICGGSVHINAAVPASNRLCPPYGNVACLNPTCLPTNPICMNFACQ